MNRCPTEIELDGFLARNEELPSDAEIASHLDQCRRCRQYVNTHIRLLIDPQADGSADLRTVVEPLLRYAPDRLPPQVDSEFLERLRFIPRACLEPKSNIAEADAKQPTQIDQYEVIKELGRGGMGRVYLVQRNGQPEHYALKLLSADFASNTEAVRRARKEIAALKSLNHPNIVRAIDDHEFKGRPYLVTEYLDGQDLQTRIAQHGPMSLRQASEILIAAARGLQHAHENGIVHRDIKPSNLFLTKSGELKLLDFGVAHHSVSSETSSQETPSGFLMGTAHYMSPEQMESARRADERSDIYSLGCLLAFLLTGEPVFGICKYYEALVAHRFKAAPSLLTKLPTLPTEVDHFYLRMLEKTPELRPQTMQEVIDTFTPYISGQPDDAVVTTNQAEVEPPPPPAEPMTTFEIVLGIMLFLAVVIFSLWLLTQGK